MINRLTIFRKGLFLIAVPLCFQLAFIGLVAAMRRNNIEAERWTIHTNEVIAQAESCGYWVLSAHGANQGFVITRDSLFRDEVRRLTAGSRQKLQMLVDLVADNPVQTLQARQVQAKATTLLDFVEESAKMVEGPGMPPDLAKTRRFQSQKILESLDEQLGRFIAEEQRLNAVRHDLLNSHWRRLDFLLIAGSVMSILSSFLIAVLFSRNISGRIETLASNARLLSDGRDLMPPLRGGDEIARLDSVFRRMAGAVAVAMRRERDDAEMASRRAEEMTSINAQLREKAQENEMFVYSVSHDLRSPLVNLQGFSKELGLIGQDLLRAVDRDGVPDDVRRQTRSLIQVEMGESVGFIQSAVTRLSAIIDALLRLSRAGRVEYRPQVVAVKPAVARVVAALRGTIDERKAQVVVGDLPPAFTDPTAIEQVFANLIGNAINYLDPKRPGRVEVSATIPHQVDGERAAEPMVIYSVADNGMGIAKSYQGKIFTAFQRLHGDVAKGEGIGLALVRRMVERNGGRVWFESEVGRGTTFSFSMPAGPSPEESNFRDAEPVLAAGSKEMA